MKIMLIATCLFLGACGKTQVNFNSPQLPSIQKTAERKKEYKKEYKRDFARFAFHKESNFDVVSYSLAGSLNVTNNLLTAKNTLQIQAKSNLNELELDSKNLIINRVTSAQKELKFTTTDKKIIISLEHELTEDTNFALSIEYSTKPNHGLHFYDGNRGDPVKSKIVYTDSEPELASSWMPCHDTPSDRATFDLTLEIPNNYLLVSNGLQISDTKINPSTHFVQWKTEIPIPTYLMAFASGELEKHSTLTAENLPISVWSRKHLPIDSEAILKTTASQLSKISHFLGPYPFEKYAIVLIPEFASSGMENASITFNEETRSSLGTVDRDISLMAHELAHHWFGDLMTIENWNDLWIKEGMANLIEAEFSDHTGILNGNYFEPNDGEAALDPALPPENKYTSGPYDRAAWIYTQVRAIAGEERFWKTLRTILKKNRFLSINTDDFINSFDHILNKQQLSWFHAAVLAHALPKATATRASIVFSDPENTLLTPFEIKQNLDRSTIVLDALNIHPKIDYFLADSEKAGAHEILSDLLQPKNETDLTLFSILNSAVQEEALEIIKKPVRVSLNSNEALILNINLACKNLVQKAIIEEMISALNFNQLTTKLRIDTCDSLFDQSFFKDFSGLKESDIINTAVFPFTMNADSWLNLFSIGKSARIKIFAAKVLNNYKTLDKSHFQIIHREISLTAITRELDSLFELINSKDDSDSIPFFSHAFMDDKLQDSYKKELFCGVFQMSKRLSAENEWMELIHSLNLLPEDPLTRGIKNPDVFCN